MPIVHGSDGKFYSLEKKDLKEVMVVCTGDGKFYTVDKKLAAKRRVKPETLSGKKGFLPASVKDLVGEGSPKHCAVCSVRG
jgi:hypothetical protein